MLSGSATASSRLPSVNDRDRSGWAWLILGSLASLVVMPLEPSLLEEGMALHIAQRIVAGEHLYRDIVFFTGPLPFELLGVLFRIFGEQVWVARAPVALLTGLASAASYAVAKRAGARSFSHVAAASWATAPILLFPLLHIYFYTTIAAYLVPLTLYAAVRGLASPRWAYAAGALLAAVCLCKQSLGAVLVVTLTIAFIFANSRAMRWRQASRLVLGGLSVGLATVIFYAARGELSALYFATVKLPLSLGSSFRAPNLNLWPPGQLDADVRQNSVLYLPYVHHLLAGVFSEPSRAVIVLTQILYATPFLALILTALRRLLWALPPASLLHSAVALALTSNLYPRGDWGHLVFVLPVSVAQLAHAVSIPRSGTRLEPGLMRALARAATLALYTLSVAFATWFFTISSPPRLGPRLPLRSVGWANRGEAVPRAIQYLRVHTYFKEPIFVARQEPLLYFATDTRNPTPYGGILVGYPPQEPQIISALDSVRFAVMSDIDQPLYHYYSRELPRLYAYLERFFEISLDFPVDNETWLFVLNRRSDRGATAFDFVENSAQGNAWVIDREDVRGPAPREAPELVTKQMRTPLAAILGPGGGGVDFAVDVPENAAFQVSVGLPFVTSVGSFHQHPHGARHVVSIARASEAFEPILTFRLSDLPPKGFARWIDLEADLSAWSGERVTLRLEIRPDEGKNLKRGDIEWWGSPRIAVRPPG